MISIIIPVYNEEARIQNLLAHLRKVSSGKLLEIIAVDGGSTDRTADILEAEKGIRYITSKKGRACQMNAGAEIAKAPILYFLHADSYPPDNFDAFILKEVAKGNHAGCFKMKFDKDHWWLNTVGHLTRINHRYCRGGDQSLFISQNLFLETGGFDETYTVYEDNDFIGKLYAKKQFVVIKEWLTTSARLYESMGVWNVQFLYIHIYWKKFLGAPPEELYRVYKRRVG